jgi:hypothetical protein
MQLCLKVMSKTMDSTKLGSEKRTSPLSRTSEVEYSGVLAVDEVDRRIVKRKSTIVPRILGTNKGEKLTEQSNLPP